MSFSEVFPHWNNLIWAGNNLEGWKQMILKSFPTQPILWFYDYEIHLPFTKMYSWTFCLLEFAFKAPGDKASTSSLHSLECFPFRKILPLFSLDIFSSMYYLHLDTQTFITHFLCCFFYTPEWLADCCLTTYHNLVGSLYILSSHLLSYLLLRLGFQQSSPSMEVRNDYSWKTNLKGRESNFSIHFEGLGIIIN